MANAHAMNSKLMCERSDPMSINFIFGYALPMYTVMKAVCGTSDKQCLAITTTASCCHNIKIAGQGNFKNPNTPKLHLGPVMHTDVGRSKLVTHVGRSNICVFLLQKHRMMLNIPSL